MASAKDMVAAFQKDYGKGVGGYGASYEDRERVPTGCFEFDLATGGGFPKGLLSIVYGPESSGKTNLAYKAVSNHQLLWPDKSCVWMAVEPFDPPWASKMGVNVDNLIVLKPDFAEQCVDMVEGMLGAEDCGLLVIDSVAAMYTSTSVEKSAEDQVMGGIGVVMSRLCDKIAHELRKAEKGERDMPTIVFVNQIRTKVGLVFGSPLTMPGGAKQKFLSSLTVRIVGKNITDNAISKVMPVRKETQFTLEKWKVPVVSVHGKFEMAMLSHNGLHIGECDDWKTIQSLLKNLGLLGKVEKGGWHLYGEVFPTLTACREKMIAEPKFAHEVRAELIKKAVEVGSVPESPE